jgi:hypothetical protein
MSYEKNIIGTMFDDRIASQEFAKPPNSLCDPADSHLADRYMVDATSRFIFPYQLGVYAFYTA